MLGEGNKQTYERLYYGFDNLLACNVKRSSGAPLPVSGARVVSRRAGGAAERM